MSNYPYFYVDKNNQTFADGLKVFGLARLLRDLLFRQCDRAGIAYDVNIHDCGSYYQLECDPPLERSTIEDFEGRLLPVKFIRTDKNESSLPPDQSLNWLNYEETRDQVQAYYATREKGGDAPFPEYWDLLRAINPAALPGYTNLLMAWWQIQEQLPVILHLLIDLYSTTPNDVDGASTYWKALDKEYGWGIAADITGQQLYNPDQGKGQNKTKSSGISIGNMKGFWLEEYLKTVGFFEAALTKTVRGGKDRKTFVIVPRRLSFYDHQALHNTFSGLMQYSEHSTRFDILAALRYSKNLIDHYLSEDQKAIEPWLADLDEAWSPRREVQGFQTAFYKDLGNAIATMNIAFIALPGWIQIKSGDDAALYQSLLDELIYLVSQLDESHSDAFNLLQHLRDFVSGDDLTQFLRFTTAYASYYISMNERGKNNIPAISTQFIERIVQVMGKKFAVIGDKEKYPGFHRIALAISESTVKAQWRKAKKKNTTYEIRYGLNQDLARNANRPEQFLERLAEFIHTYNAETGRAQELGKKPWRPMIEPDDINDVLKLMDDFPNSSRMIAQLLIAYGYTFIPVEFEEQQENE